MHAPAITDGTEPGTEAYIRAAEVADRLKVSVRHVHYLVRRGELIGVRMGRVLRVRPADLAAYEARILAEAKAAAAAARGQAGTRTRESPASRNTGGAFDSR